jgi:DNA-binding response OmpR family regulator
MHNGRVPTVLLVDDEPIVREVVARYLRREGFETIEAGNGLVARQLLEQEEPALVVLDVMMPGLDGLALCRWIRSRSDLPVILLTARGEETDRIVGLELGADDYVTKPFSPRELAVRVKTVLRRAGQGGGAGAAGGGDTDVARGPVEAAGLVVDPVARTVERDGAELRLTAKEFDLLHFHLTHPRQVFSRDQLMQRVWGYTAALDSGTVTVHVRRLREKIEPDPARPRHLETVWGVGYRLTP